MAKLKTWLLHNGTLKAISVAGALIIWIFVANYSNPLTEDFLETSIITKNAAEFTQGDRVYTLSADTVRVSYKTREKYAGTVKPYEIKAYVDLSGLDRSLSVVKTPVSLEIPEKYDGIIYDVQFEPQNVVISTENIQQKKFAVECMMTGSPAQGYIEGEASLSPEYFYVRGPVSVIGQISSTGIIVDMENATGDVNGNTDIIFYDANGNVLTGIEKKLSFAGVIDYHVPVYRTKSLSVNAFAGGMPATGYTVESVEVSPTFVQVYGSEEALSKNSVIIIPGSAINAAGRKENLTLNIDISEYIPEGLSLVNSNTEVTVLVKLRNVFEKEEEENPAETGGDKQPENHESAHEAETAAPVHDPLIGDTQTASPSEADDEAVQDENVNTGESQGSEEVPEQEEAPAPEEIPEEGSSENAG